MISSVTDMSRIKLSQRGCADRVENIDWIILRVVDQVVSDEGKFS